MQGSNRKVVFFMTYYVGVDIAKYTHFASIIDSNGTVIEHPFSFANNEIGFKLLLAKLQNYPKSEMVIGYESTAHYHLNLHHFLDDSGYKTALINPILTKRLRSISIRNVKNDKVDSLTIALFLYSNYSKLNLSDNGIQELRVICNQIHELKQTKAKLYIQLTACLDLTFPEIKAAFFKGNLKSNAAHNLLKKYNTAKEISAITPTKLVKIISKNSKRFNKNRVESLVDLAKHSVGINSKSISIKIRQIIEQVELIERQIEDLLDVICNDEIVRDCALLQIPGMGYLQAANILSVIYSIERFDSPEQVLAYAGLDPIIRQSGLFNAKSTRMSKRGNSLLRYTLIWSALNCSKNSKTMSEYYLKKRNEGKSHYNALGHCARKLTNYIFWILTHPNDKFNLD